MADLSLWEKVSDVADKVSAVSAVAMGVLPGGAFRFGTESVRGIPQRVFKNLPPSLSQYYKIWFEKFADDEWLVYENERYTFGEVHKQYMALGAELTNNPHFNVQPGDKVGIVMRNYPELLISFLAVTAAGGVAVPLNALWKSEELEYAVGDAGCKVVIADPERLELCVPFAAKLGFKTVVARGSASLPQAMTTGAVAWADVLTGGSAKLAASKGKMLWTKRYPEDEAMIMYTSGSTGFPKGVVHTHRSVGTAMKVGEMSSVAFPDPDGVQLMAVPLFHITALCPVGLFSIPAGTKIVMMRKWEPGQALKVIEHEKVTRFTGVPTMMIDLMEHPDWDPRKVASLRGVIAGGAPVPPSQVKQMRAKSKKISSGQGYGLTESMALGTVNRGADYLRHPTSCGKPIPLMMDVAIIDPKTGKKVPEGERGEVCLKSAAIMKCYHNKPEKTAEAIDKDGYFHSGDIGKSVGGFVYILDRMKDLIIRGGENIDCSEVEAALASHPAVRECSVFGVPDRRLGEQVGCAIWCTDPAVTSSEISAHAALTLAKFKVPPVENVWLHKEELPKGATGKLDKKGLRDHYGGVVKTRSPASKL